MGFLRVVVTLQERGLMSDFPSEYGSLPNLKEQGLMWLATLPAGIVSFYGPLQLDRMFSVPGHALSPDRLPFCILGITFLIGTIYGLFDRRFANFTSPAFSVTWRIYLWTLLVAAFLSPLLIIGIVLMPQLSVAGWVGMIIGYVVASKVQLLIRKRLGASISEGT
ncbi:MAG: hypothetical protein CBB60_003540 [Armatimonadetes bacterium Cent15-Ar3]|nr:MAG: hypothetical protein CBB60_003540 [Armatimonadetes bacterium Cent15-Ar3]